MNCEICKRPLDYTPDEIPHDLGTYHTVNDVELCPLGCDEKLDLGPTISVAKMAIYTALNKRVEGRIKCAETLETLDDWIDAWWAEVGQDEFLRENS